MEGSWVFVIYFCPRDSLFAWPGLTHRKVTAQEVGAVLAEGTGLPSECPVLGNGPLLRSAGRHRRTWQLCKAFLGAGRGDEPGPWSVVFDCFCNVISLQNRRCYRLLGGLQACGNRSDREVSKPTHGISS